MPQEIQAAHNRTYRDAAPSIPDVFDPSLRLTSSTPVVPKEEQKGHVSRLDGEGHPNHGLSTGFGKPRPAGLVNELLGGDRIPFRGSRAVPRCRQGDLGDERGTGKNIKRGYKL